MTKNREIAEFIFSKMKELGFEAYDIDYGNGYFIFDMGEDSVIHFRVKGLWKNWKFGMWVNSQYLDRIGEVDENGKPLDFKLVQLFAQYETQINKFKPSRSELCVEYDADSWNEEKKDNGLYFYELEKMLKMMKRHPLICYSEFCGDCAGYYDESFILTFIRCESKYYWSEFVEKFKTAVFLPYTKAKIFFAKKDKCIKDINLFDFEKECKGWKTDYLYRVDVTFTKDCTSEEEIKWLDKWFRKDKYGKYNYYDCVVELGLLHKEGREKGYSYIMD